jgi:hypothetical protein
MLFYGGICAILFGVLLRGHAGHRVTAAHADELSCPPCWASTYPGSWVDFGEFSLQLGYSPSWATSDAFYISCDRIIHLLIGLILGFYNPDHRHG